MPHLSVVIPAYDAEPYIAECLESVLGQRHAPSFEIIVVDDGSRDRTAAVVAERFPGVRLLSKANGGPGSARNFGVCAARAPLIVFTDADDVMLPGRLAFQGRFMLDNPQFALSFGNLIFAGEPSRDANAEAGFRNSESFSNVPAAYARLLVDGNFVINGAACVRRDAYLAVGGQPEDISVGEDYAMNCAIARRFPIAASRRPLTWYRQGHGGNLTSSPRHYDEPLQVLIEQLQSCGTLLTPKQRRMATRRAQRLANSLLRWLWIEQGEQAVLTRLQTLTPLLSAPARMKWRVLAAAPSRLGRTARSAKRWLAGNDMRVAR